MSSANRILGESGLLLHSLPSRTLGDWPRIAALGWLSRSLGSGSRTDVRKIYPDEFVARG